MSERTAVPAIKNAAFLAALAVLALLIVVNILTLQQRTQSQESAANVINVAGRQRMLSQRMALLAENLVRAEAHGQRADIRKELTSAIALFERSHRGLTVDGPEKELPGDLPPDAREIYFEPPVLLDEQVKRYVESLESLAEMSDAQPVSRDPCLQRIWATATGRKLLNGLDAAVTAFQTDSEAKVASLGRRIWWAFGGTLLTVGITFWLAFSIFSRTRALEEAHRRNLHMLEEVDEARQKAEQAERDVRGREAELRAILNTAVDGVITIDERGIVESINPAAERLFVYATGELIGQKVNVLMPPPYCDEHDTYIRRYLETGEKKVIDTRREVIGKRKDGATLPLELAVSCVQLDDRKLFAAILRDLTEHKQAELTERELDAARQIQERLLPTDPPELPGFDIAGGCQPAAATGGDYYDYIPMANGCWGVVVADASSHGFAPALIMAGTRRALRTLAAGRAEIGDLLTIANRAVMEDTQDQHFVTLFFAHVDPRTRSLTYAGAGHDAYLIKSPENVVKLESTGFPLGMMEDAVVASEQRITLERGDILLLFTDGFQEARSPDGRFFGIQPVLDVVHRHRNRSARETVDALFEAVRAFCHPNTHQDDVTVVVLKIEPV